MKKANVIGGLETIEGIFFYQLLQVRLLRFQLGTITDWSLFIHLVPCYEHPGALLQQELKSAKHTEF